MNELHKKNLKTRNTQWSEISVKKSNKLVQFQDESNTLSNHDKNSHLMTSETDNSQNMRNTSSTLDFKPKSSLIKVNEIKKQFDRLRKNVLTAEKRKIFEDIDNQEDLNCRENFRKEELQVKKLIQWENDKLKFQKDKLKDYNLHEKNNSASNEDIESQNYEKKFSKLNFKSVNQLQDIVKKTSAENCSIFLQNINLSKKKFNFDVFKTNEIVTNDFQLKRNYIHIVQMNEPKDSLSQDLNFVKQLKNYNIEIDGNLDAMANVDLYRNIIKEKMKIENGYRKDLINVSQKLHELKIEKKNLEKINALSLREVEKAKRDLENYKENFILSKKEQENKFNELYFNFIEEAKNNKNVNKKNLEDDLYQMRKEYQNHIEELENNLRNYKSNYEKKILELADVIKQNKVTILAKEKEIKQSKFIFNHLIKEQKIYYLDILKKGIDVRGEGLIWLVKRLIELNTVMEYSMFPRFLDHNHIDYLLKLSYKQIEYNQLKTILTILKEKQKVVKDSDIKDINEKIMLRTKTSNFSSNKHTSYSTNILMYSPNSTSTNFQQTMFSFKTMKAFDNIFHKYNNMIKRDFEHKIEDFKIQQILNELKIKLKGYYNKSMEEESINIDKRENEIFNDILTIRNNIQELEKEIDKMRKDEIVLFKRKYDSFKTNIKFNIQHDLIYSALFGNNIIV